MSTAITGATGFLGLHLVRELLRHEDHLLLLARPHQVPAPERVARFLRATCMPEAQVRAARRRLSAVDSDVRRPRLGLSAGEFRRLADRVDTLWHCAGNVSFSAQDSDVPRTNTDGTRHVLDLLTAGERAPVLYHVSTIAVAGNRLHDTLYEEAPERPGGFLAPYEESKFAAELLVRRWAAEHARPAVVFRPGGLVTRRPGYPGRPRQIAAMAADTFRAAIRAFPEAAGTDGSFTVRAAERGGVNLLPVEHAAYAMAEVPRRRAPAGVRTYHVVSPRDTPAGDIAAALSTHLDVTIRLDTRPDAPLSPASRALHDMLGAYASWLRVTRRYDDTNLAALGLACPAEPAVDAAYLRACLA
ncbi:SDR family oxidoreductase [Streptomyces sp. URMC 129]|uniref:SDR family oxidoreductase n=1 Tax=Streptomyces sp. URMC 129 TaxID=3423407 RepID=UPI003F1A3659